MKTIFFVIGIILQLNSFAGQLHSDSVKVFQTSDTTYGLGVYGVTLPSGPCTVAERIVNITKDSIVVSLCFLYGNSQSQTCKARDTIDFGVLPLSSYTIIVCLGMSDTTTNTCNTPLLEDTIELTFLISGIRKIPFEDFFIFYNAESHHLKGEFKILKPAMTATIISLQGSYVIEDIPILDNKLDIDVSALPAGIYFLQLSDEKQRVVKKFVKY